MSNSRGVVYKPFKNEVDDAKVILFDEDSIKIEKRQTHCFLKKRQKSVFILCSGLVIFLTLSVVLCFVIVHNNSKKGLFEKFILRDRNNENLSCSPLKSVKEIEIVLIQDSHNFCLDTFTCDLLIHEIVQNYSNNNLSYNFLVNSDFRVILVFGYSFSTDSCSVPNTVDFRISYMKNNHVSERRSEEISREIARGFMEIIYHGIKCNRNQSNFTMTSLCVDGFNLSSCGSVFKEEILWLEMRLSDKPDISHSSNSETTSILQRNLKWSVCEDPLKDVVHSHPKKLSESLARNSCTHYEPVDHISVEVVELPHKLHCFGFGNSSCNSFSNIIEAEHDGLNYNFILGYQGIMYVGTGFHCRTNNTRPKSLRIKVVRFAHAEIMDHVEEMRRMSEIINHGLTCGKILKNYSISDNCFISSCFPKYNNISHDMMTILSTNFRRYKNEMGMNGEFHKVVPLNKLWIPSTSCHHKEHLSSSLKTETIDKINKTFLPDKYSVKTITVQPTFKELEEASTSAIELIDHIQDLDYEGYEYDEYLL